MIKDSAIEGIVREEVESSLLKKVHAQATSIHNNIMKEIAHSFMRGVTPMQQAYTTHTVLVELRKLIDISLQELSDKILFGERQ